MARRGVTTVEPGEGKWVLRTPEDLPSVRGEGLGVPGGRTRVREGDRNWTF